MRKKLNKLLAALLALALVSSMTGGALAYNTLAETRGTADVYADFTAQDPASPSTFSVYTSAFISINKPKNKAVYYKGEKIPVDVTVWDCWDTYYTLPLFALSTSKDNDFRWGTTGDGTVQVDGYTTYRGSIDTKKIAAGSYYFNVMTLAVPDADSTLDDSVLTGEEEWARIPITLKTLKAPTKLKATAGKRKVTITYKAASGAKKYEIYRSTKKSSGYKKVATTTKTKYVDKKVKKGKKYYYKVRSVRTGNGTVRSSYTGAVKTGKVK